VALEAMNSGRYRSKGENCGIKKGAQKNYTIYAFRLWSSGLWRRLVTWYDTNVPDKVKMDAATCIHPEHRDLKYLHRRENFKSMSSEICLVLLWKFNRRYRDNMEFYTSVKRNIFIGKWNEKRLFETMF